MNGLLSRGGYVRRLPGTAYLIGYTAAIWSAWFATSAGSLWLRMGITPNTLCRAATLFLAGALGAFLCLALDWILRRTRLRPLAEAAGLSLLIGSAAAILWMVLGRLAVAPLVRQLFEAGGATASGLEPQSDLSASAALFIFLAWITAWLSVSYAEELREKQAQVAKALERIVALEDLLGSTGAAVGEGGSIDHLWVPESNGTARISIDDVSTLRAEGDYVRLRTGDGREFLVRASLRQFEAQLPGDRFVRVHRSAIVNVDHVAGVTRRTPRAWGVQLKDGPMLPVGKTHVRALRQLTRRA